MPVTITEKFDSRAGTKSVERPTIELRYSAQGSEDDAAVKAAFESVRPLLYQGLVFQDYSYEHVGGGIWEIVARYGKREPAPTNQTRWRIQTGGATAKITQALETVGSYAAPGETAPDFRGAIGVTDDAVEGVEIIVRQFKFTGTRRVPIPAVTSAYLDAIYSLTGVVNDSPLTVQFFGVAPITFAPGELLLEDVSADQPDEEYVELVFSFSASPNKTGLTVGDIQNIVKDGWHYLWARYRDDEDAAAKQLVKRATSVYVERVYEQGNFTVLGL